MTYRQAVRYLDSFTNYEKKDGYDYKKTFKLETMRRLCSLLGDPQKGIKSLHIAGSKGKGSTSAIVQSILMRAGFRTGLYTSPHLVSFTERIRVNDILIPKASVARLLEKVRHAIKKMEDPPSLFEIYTAIAYLYFKEERVDFAVYEVGLGGRLDATNVIKPLVCGITPISYEHTDKLGDTLEKIASEKAGIIKDNGVCVVAPQAKEALSAIEKMAAGRKAKIFLVGRDINFKEVAAKNEKEIFSVSGICGDYPLLEMKLLGAHQMMNAATAIGAVEALRFSGTIISPDAIREGIASARWAGRLEIAARSPLVVLDGAQNRASAHALAGAVKRSFKYRKLVLVLGVSNDTDIKGILSELLPVSDSAVLTKSRIVERAMDPEKIKKAMPVKYHAVITSKVEDALGEARKMARYDDLILVTGSLFVVGDARKVLSRGAPAEQYAKS